MKKKKEANKEWGRKGQGEGTGLPQTIGQPPNPYSPEPLDAMHGSIVPLLVGSLSLSPNS